MKAVSLQDSLLFEFKNRIIGECLRNGRLKTANPCRKGFVVFYFSESGSLWGKEKH